MKSARIVCSGSNARLLESAGEFLGRWSPATEVLAIAPTRIAADEIVRKACSTGLRGIHRFTVRQLASVLARHAMAERGLAPISRLGMEALAARAVHLLIRESQLEYFHPVAGTPGFARALASTLSEIRLQKIGTGELAAIGAPGRDLSRLLALFTGELTVRKLADFQILLELSTETALDAKHRLTKLPFLLASVPLESAAERAFVAALAERSPAVLATMLRYDGACKDYEAILGVTAEELPDNTDALDILRAQLFSTASLPQRDLDPACLEIFSAPGEGLECVEIARRVRAAAASGIPFDRMGVLLRHPGRYQPMLEEAFRRAGIPVYFTRGSTRPNPAGRALLALLDCAAEGCSASKFAEYLSLGQVPSVETQPNGWVPPDDETLGSYSNEIPALELQEDPTETDESPVIAGSLRTPAGWEKLLVDAYVVHGADRWERRLRGLRESLRQEAGAEDNASRRQHIEREIQQLANLEKFALPIVRFLWTFGKPAAWNDWLARLETLAYMSLRQPDAVLSVLAEMRPLADVGPIDLHEVRGVLSEHLRFLRSEPPEGRYGRIWAGGIDEARAFSFDTVFLPGLAEGAFPRRAFEDPLLLDEYRKHFDLGMTVNEDRTAGERLLLRIAAAATETRLVVSYPRMDVVQSRPRVPSFYALEVVRAAEGRLPDLARFGRLAASGSTTLLGWPAPDDPQLAIDDAEFDIATLRLCLSLPPEQAKGCGRYLIEVHDTLARTLRTRWKRWSKTWSTADGLVEPDGQTRAALASLRLTIKSYSASSLQHFAACPYRFVLHAIHHLRSAERPVALEQMDPLTRGELFHKVQFQLLQLLEKDELLAITEIRLPEILERADRVFDEVAAEFEERLAPAIPRVWRSEVDELRADVHGWLRDMAGQQGNWIPFRFEYAFGMRPGKSRDARSTEEEAVILDGFRLRGSIDLIEQQAGTGKLRITDHKTGKPPEQHPVSIGGGAALQPVLYGLAVEGLLNSQVESGRLSYATQRGNFLAIDLPLDKNARERARLALHTIDNAIESGFLPAAPRQGACDYCDYRPVCGPHEELRTKGKPKTRLEALYELRAQP